MSVSVVAQILLHFHSVFPLPGSPPPPGDNIHLCSGHAACCPNRASGPSIPCLQGHVKSE